MHFQQAIAGCSSFQIRTPVNSKSQQTSQQGEELKNQLMVHLKEATGIVTHSEEYLF